MTPGMVSVLNTPRFDSGYIFGVRLRGLLEEFHLWALVFQRYACFNSGYKFIRCPQAPDACHHGRYGPEGMLCVAVQKTADFPQLQFFKVVDIPVVTRRLIPVVLGTVEIPQLRVDMVVDAPVMQLVQIVVVLSWCRGCFLRSRLLSDQSDYPAAGHGDRCPCCAGRERSTRAVVEKTVVLPRLHCRGFRLEEQLFVLVLG